jgi:hypothetical protein
MKLINVVIASLCLGVSLFGLAASGEQRTIHLIFVPNRRHCWPEQAELCANRVDLTFSVDMAPRHDKPPVKRLLGLEKGVFTSQRTEEWPDVYAVVFDSQADVRRVLSRIKGEQPERAGAEPRATTRKRQRED